MPYTPPDMRLQALRLAEVPEYGGPQRASVGMMMWLAGLTGGVYPDVQYVQAFARHNPGRRDLDTVLGAAMSFSQSTRRVYFAGVPAAPQQPAPTDLRQWQGRLAELPNTETSYEPPKVAQLEELLQEPDGIWAIKMDVAGAALAGSTVAFQPVIVIGLHDNVLTVHNPGSIGMPAQANQELDVGEAFGRTAKAQSRVSILAVRMAVGAG